MTKTRVMLLILLLATPSALAWGAKGSYEPDTRRDITDGWMFGTPDVNPAQTVNKVYFNGFQGTGAGSLDPNAAAARSSIEYGASYSLYAVLGVWKDCNKDGYIGLGDNGLVEYRVELLLDTSVCPKQTVPTTIPPNWFPVHNDGQWIHELLPIQWLNTQATVDDNPWNVNDNAARVWADYGLPGVEQRPSLECWITPQPRTTYHSTGGLLSTFDCFTGHQLTETFDNATDSNTATRPLSFSDHPRDQYASASTLNAKNPWGEESDASFVQAWDCSQPQLVKRDLTTADSVNVSQPRIPPGISTSGSLAGTLNATGSGIDQCRRDTTGNAHLHPGKTTSTAPYYLEGDVVDFTIKTDPDATMFPRELNRPATPYAAVLGRGSPPFPGDGAGHGEFLDGDGGTKAISSDGFWQDFVGRTEVPLLDARMQPARPQAFTFYALVSANAISTFGLQLPKGSTFGVYGQEACNGASTGIHGGWDCDATHWYKDTAGNDIEPKSRVYLGNGVGYGSRPGDLYDLRDVDCYDESAQALRGGGITSGILTGTTCDLAP